jgi:3D (Asp-Asp-Asp) domain-containing protein
MDECDCVATAEGGIGLMHRIGILRDRLSTSGSAGFVLLGVLGALAITILLTAVVTAETGSGPAITVTVIADGQEWEWVSCEKTVGGVLREAGVTLGAKDRVIPKLSSRTSNGLRIRVTRITDEVVVQNEPVKFKTVVKFDPHGSGDKKVLCEGVSGEKEVKYLFTYKDGVKVGSKVLSSKITKQPVSEVVSLTRDCFTRGTLLASRSGSYTRSIRMVATAYAPFHCGGSKSGRTACGMMAGYGIVAVDPRVIRLGTKLYVEDYGFCVAGDTGGAIKGTRIDLGFDTYSEAIRFGRRTVAVYVLD